METKNLKCKTKEFFNKNKKKIRICAKLTFAITAGTIIVSQKNMLEQTRQKLVEKKKIIDIMAKKIANQEECMSEKDKYYKKFISMLLRQGNSEGAREMAYRRYYLAKKIGLEKTTNLGYDI